MSASTTLPRQGSVPTDREQARSWHGKRRVDARLSELFQEIQGLGTKQVLRHLVLVVRERSSLLDPAHLPRRGVPGAEALRNLAACESQFIRPIDEWSGCAGSARDVVHSLAEHLLCHYPVPRVLSASWFAPWDGCPRQAWRWFIEHGSGRRLRDLDLPVPLTRSMERHFLTTPHHFTVEQALRRGELMGLGASAWFARYVCEQTRLGYDLSESAFWRTVVVFLVRVQDEVQIRDLGPIVDFLHGVRFATTETLGQEGVEWIGPAQPEFSIRGRTLASVLRLVDDWHASLGQVRPKASCWAPSPYQPLRLRRGVSQDGEPVLWEIAELRSGEDLYREGVSLQHCVGTYATHCVEGRTRIWSLRSRRGPYRRSLLTIEIDLVRGAIVQVRGLRNRLPNGAPLDLLKTWAKREGLILDPL